mmetsp:Transcript_2883/g.10980  ORF Transcript_2883/g.10980 Transcript_2883/m.10980 type:complete len:298 (+) Transcript_2883:400-1293(+)
MRSANLRGQRRPNVCVVIGKRIRERVQRDVLLHRHVPRPAPLRRGFVHVRAVLDVLRERKTKPHHEGEVHHVPRVGLGGEPPGGGGGAAASPASAALYGLRRGALFGITHDRRLSSYPPCPPPLLLQQIQGWVIPGDTKVLRGFLRQTGREVGHDERHGDGVEVFPEQSADCVGSRRALVAVAVSVAVVPFPVSSAVHYVCRCGDKQGYRRHRRTNHASHRIHRDGTPHGAHPERLRELSRRHLFPQKIVIFTISKKHEHGEPSERGEQADTEHRQCDGRRGNRRYREELQHNQNNG